jgi:hypothetical protein
MLGLMPDFPKGALSGGLSIAPLLSSSSRRPTTTTHSEREERESGGGDVSAAAVRRRRVRGGIFLLEGLGRRVQNQ